MHEPIEMENFMCVNLFQLQPIDVVVAVTVGVEVTVAVVVMRLHIVVNVFNFSGECLKYKFASKLRSVHAKGRRTDIE